MSPLLHFAALALHLFFFQYEPAVEGRAACNYVGLKNAGATCYMNSVIQQLFLVPGFKESLLSIDDEDSDEDNLFFQFQMVMGHLQVIIYINVYLFADQFLECLPTGRIQNCNIMFLKNFGNVCV